MSTSTNGVVLGYQAPSCSSGSFGCGGREGALPADLVGACTDDRWIGFQLSGVARCPAARRSRYGTWKITRPFSAFAQPNLPTELLRFCVYEWRPRTGYLGGPVIGALPDTPAMRLERDCRSVVPLLTPGGGSRPIFEDAHAMQMNLPDVSPAAVFPSPTRATVAVVDTSPTETASGLPSPGADGHGLVVGALARRTSCLRAGGAELECAARIKSYQGLPLGDGMASYGRPFDVALAMARALAEWTASGTADKLIINLSLGWDDRYSGLHGPGIRMTGLAPWLVSQWAVCEGALVIAAAGNRSQVGGATGPMFPGGWEQEPRICPGPPNLYSPLIHAAGAVDGKDETLRIARPGGNPRLLAPSAFATAVAPNAAGGHSRGKLVSGTSVSAANLSGTAALVWAMDPTLGSDQVMEHIYRGAVFLGDPPDFANPQGLWTQGRVDTCGAATRVCSPALHNCPIGCVARGAGMDAQPDYLSAFDAEFPGRRAGPETVGASISNFLAVPQGDEATIEPHAGPQPGGTICPLCGFDTQYLIGQLELTPEMNVQEIFLRPKPCSPGWCDPELGGFYLDIPDPGEFFKIDMSEALDVGVLTSAMLEVSTETNGEEIVRSAELFIYP